MLTCWTEMVYNFIPDLSTSSWNVLQSYKYFDNLNSFTSSRLCVFTILLQVWTNYLKHSAEVCTRLCQEFCVLTPSSYPGGPTCSISSTRCSTFTATSIHTSELPYADQMCQYGQTQGQLPSYNQSDHCYREIVLHQHGFSQEKIFIIHFITDRISH